MNIYEQFSDIDKQHSVLEEKTAQVGTDDDWINEAIKNGLKVEDRHFTSVSRKLESYGPTVHIWSHIKDSAGHDNLIGTAEYTAFNNKWIIRNF